MEQDWKQTHKELGCEGCIFCDIDALYKRPCCTSYVMPRTDSEGKCKTRKEQDTNGKD